MAIQTMVALGDSVMWGQGLEPASKFVTLVWQKLAAPGASPANMTLLAHSGAKILVSGADPSPGPWGEVPEASPSILRQVVDAPKSVTDATKIELVLLNGGINDVNPFNVVMAMPFDPAVGASLQARIGTVFSASFAALLASTAATFPNALIVVPSYYPIISPLTNGRALVGLLKQMPLPPDSLAFVDDTVETMADGLIEVAIAADRQAMAEQSVLFVQRSNDLMQQVIKASPQASRIVFAPVPWKPENAFAAPQTFLWMGSDDPMHGQRLIAYADFLRTHPATPLAWPPETPLASMCHPNVRGAQTYADAILAAIGTRL